MGSRAGPRPWGPLCGPGCLAHGRWREEREHGPRVYRASVDHPGPLAGIVLEQLQPTDPIRVSVPLGTADNRFHEGAFRRLFRHIKQLIGLEQEPSTTLDLRGLLRGLSGMGLFGHPWIFKSR